jgi:hypothetical protein
MTLNSWLNFGFFLSTAAILILHTEAWLGIVLLLVASSAIQEYRAR